MMNKKLTEIAQKLKSTNKKVQLIYAFNGSGKTRLSREFKELIAPKTEDRTIKILYYSAFTEDLFYWDNDLDLDVEPKLKIQPNNFTNWILEEQGQYLNIITNFQHYGNNKITPAFNEAYQTDKNGNKIVVPKNSEITFRLYSQNVTTSDNEILATPDGQAVVTSQYENIKISKSEESIFIWSIFYSLLDQVIGILNVSEPGDRETDQFNKLEYVFIDDPVSSLDDNHLIELAVNVAGLIKSSESTDLKFIITTHSPLFYNVLHNELNNNTGYLLEHSEDGFFDLLSKDGDSNKSFSYHLYLKQILEKAVNKNQIQKYHFMLLRNLYEKTAGFLNYPQWSDLLPDDPDDKENKTAYLNRIIHFNSHSTVSTESVAEPTPQEKKMVKFLLDHLCDNYGYRKRK